MFRVAVNLGIILTVTAGAVQAAEIEFRTTQCRLYDSRNVGTGAKITTATIETRGDAGSGQGGESGCGAPPTASGVVVNLVSFEAVSAGHGRLWAFGETEPLAVSINVATTVAENTGLLVLVGDDGKLSWHSVFTGHLVIELSGWIDGAGESRERSSPSNVIGPRHRRFLTFQNVPFAPGVVDAGDRFVVSSSGTVGAFVGHENEWVYWDGSGWIFEEPQDGDLGFEASSGDYWRYRALDTPEWSRLTLD